VHQGGKLLQLSQMRENRLLHLRRRGDVLVSDAMGLQIVPYVI
jgi:hypothetical protein